MRNDPVSFPGIFGFLMNYVNNESTDAPLHSMSYEFLWNKKTV